MTAANATTRQVFVCFVSKNFKEHSIGAIKHKTGAGRGRQVLPLAGNASMLPHRGILHARRKRKLGLQVLPGCVV